MSNRFNKIILDFKNDLITKSEAKLRLAELKKTPISSKNIAVIGMSGQFPGAKNINEFWSNLLQGNQGVQELPLKYFDQEKYFSKNKSKDKSYCKWGGYLEDRDSFDPVFFSMSPKDALDMDPHQRLILLESIKTFEDSGYDSTNMSHENVGVYIGAEPSGYSSNSFTGSSQAIIASRVSYCLNLNGPALVVNTGCSSSGVAIHLAAESLRNGECNFALAGGVFAGLDSQAVVGLSQMDMLSPTGICSTFDAKGDGTIVSEGVALVLLKKLSNAIRDKDDIYGVIKASGMNQDGTSNGMTAPNGKAQEKLIKDVYDKYSIDPNKISYVEAHGTGTKLGDSVEANALGRVWEKCCHNKNDCFIGSAKSHIGHTSAASGVIGLIKVLLSMKYNTVPGLLNFETLNPAISWENSPLCINVNNKPWISNSSQNNRLAAINSFGHSGTNVHLVVSDIISDEIVNYHTDVTMVFPFSAKRKEDLREMIKAYEKYLYSNKNKLNINRLAFTLQTGRGSYKYKVCFWAESLDELERRLKGFNWEAEHKRKNAIELELRKIKFRSEEVTEKLNHLASVAIKKENLKKMAELWLKGVTIPWKKYWRKKGSIPSRMHLPTYPFKLLKFNINEVKEKEKDNLEYTFSFIGTESFLEDHQINGDKILSASATLNILLAIFKKNNSLGLNVDCIDFKNVVWVQHFIYSESNKQIKVLFTELPGIKNQIAFRFKIQSMDIHNPIMYCEGNLIESESDCSPEFNVKKYNASKSLDINGEDLYKIYKNLGVEFGPSYKRIDKLCIFPEFIKTFILVENVPINQKEMFDIGVLDSVFQGIIGREIKIDQKDKILAMESSSNPSSLVYPFTLDEMKLHKPLMESQTCYLIPNSHRSKGVISYNIFVFDSKNALCLSIKNFVCKTDKSYQPQQNELITMGPVWSPYNSNKKDFKKNVRVSIFLKENVTEDNEFHFENPIDLQKSFTLEVAADEASSDFSNLSIQLFDIIKSKLLPLKHSEPIYVELYIPQSKGMEKYGALFACLKSFHMEMSRFIPQCILYADDYSIDHVHRMWQNVEEMGEFKYNGSIRQLNLKPLDFKNTIQKPWKGNSTYILTGGLGGVGKLLLNDISHSYLLKPNPHRSHIIVTGRSPINAENQKYINQLSGESLKVEYYPVDLGDSLGVHKLVDEIKKIKPKIRGLIHSAGVVKDNLVKKKHVSEFSEVLKPKVRGICNLLEAIGEQSLDFSVLFSSGAGLIGNAGQVDYAVANSFLDHLSTYQHTNTLWSNKNIRSINWPLWKDGGMKVGAAAQEAMFSSSGMRPMTTENGLDVFYKCIESNSVQTVVVEGDGKKIKKTFMGGVRERHNDLKSDHNLNKIKSQLIIDTAEHLGFGTDEIDLETELNEYGFDSITFTEFANYLNKKYSLDLMPTLFYEHTTLLDVSQYLFDYKFYELNAELSLKEPVSNVESYHSEKSVVTEDSRQILNSKEYDNSKDIAIIGMSAAFPGAENLDLFWENLIAGKDSISEIPNNRWSWEDLYGDPNERGNQTNIKWGGFVEGIGSFDPKFFGITPKEAELMDPQQRLLMTHVWQAMEHAGYSAESLNGSDTGIIAATTPLGYSNLATKRNLQIDGFGATGSSGSIGPNRISFFMNWHGPSEPVETACSSSLVALHRGIQSLNDNSCQMIFVGGVNTLVDSGVHIALSKAGMLSPTGKCHTFSDHADGYVRGEGAAIIVLKKMSSAKKDGDSIYGIIKSSSVNHGGRASSLTAPNPKAQAELIKRALQAASINPATISYIETHGTGTELGDPIEINGLKSAFDTDNIDNKQIVIGLGSVKTNIGHLELAAGIAGLIKILLQFKYEKLAPTLNCIPKNPYVKLQNTPFYLVKESAAWKRKHTKNGELIPLRAGLSSFGFGGVNCHVVLEESAKLASLNPIKHDSIDLPLVISAKNNSQLIEYLKKWMVYSFDKINLKDLIHTSLMGRDSFSKRVAIFINDVSQIRAVFEDILNYLTQDAQMIKPFDGPELEGGNWFFGDSDRYQEYVDWIGNETLENILQSWLQEKNINGFAKHWVRGGKVNWSSLITPDWSRVEIPIYPLSKEIYWVPIQNQSSRKPKDLLEAVQPSNDVTEVKLIDEKWLVAELKDMLHKEYKIKYSDILLNENWIELGLDSIGLVDFSSKLNQKFGKSLGMKVTPAFFFSHPNLDKLVSGVFKNESAKNQFVKKTSVMSSSNSEPKNQIEDIAIISMGGRFPGADTLDELWEIISKGKSTINPISNWRLSQWESLMGTFNSNINCGFLNRINEFDPLFFEIPPVDAQTIDPRQRILLMECYKVLENAGMGSIGLSRDKIGVFVGAEQGDYDEILRANWVGDSSASITSNHNGILPSRIAYFMDLKGPTLCIDTACSSGLVALHEACNSIKSGDCSAAIVAGVNILNSPYGFLGMKKSGMLSENQVFRVFDQQSDGMLPGEAAAVVMVKSLSKAIEDNNKIHAVIKSSGINYDGKTNGISAPNGEAQKDLIKEVYSKSNLDVNNLDLIVAHGTGTKLGDPIEVNSWGEYLEEARSSSSPVNFISIKPNFGHSLAASGLVSLISLVQSIKHEQIPPSIHCKNTNEHFSNLNRIQINNQLRKWVEIKKGNRLCAVSSFGMSGTNAHVVLAPYVQKVKDQTLSRNEEFIPNLLLFCFSAKTTGSLKAQISNIIDYVNKNKFTSLIELSRSLVINRIHHNHRVYVISSSKTDLIGQLNLLCQKEIVSDFYHFNENQFSGTLSQKIELSRVLNSYLKYLQNPPKSKFTALNALANSYRIGVDWIPDNIDEGLISVPCLELPNYSFDNDFYWANEAGRKKDHSIINNTKPSNSKYVFNKEIQEQNNIYSFQEKWVEKKISLGESVNYDKVITLGYDSFGNAELKRTLQTVTIGPESILDMGEIKSFLSSITIPENISIVFLVQIKTDGKGDFQHYQTVFTLLKHFAALQLNPKKVLVTLGIGAGDLDFAIADSFLGFERSIKMILPDSSLQFIIHERNWNLKYVTISKALLHSKNTSCWYKGAKRFESHIFNINEAIENEIYFIEENLCNKTVLITGGLGGLGFIFAKYLSSKASKNKWPLKIILSGRSILDHNGKEKIKTISSPYVEVTYWQWDVTKEIYSPPGEVDGVLHCGGLSASQVIFESSWDDFQNVMEPKITGTLNLIHHFGHCDFLVLFSSSAAILGDLGSCSYSIANRFQLALANNQMSSNIKAMAWPLWKKGGMQMDSEGGPDQSITKLYLESSGQELIEDKEGCLELEKLMCSSTSSRLIMKGDKQRINKILSAKDDFPKEKSSGVKLEETSNDDIYLQLKELISNHINVPEDRIFKTGNLASLGYDSIKLTELAKKLKSKFGLEITPAFFFGYSTPEKIHKYLKENLSITSDTGIDRLSHFSERNMHVENRSSLKPINRGEEKEMIAVIGMSARFGKTVGLDEFWKLLSEGESSIGDVPNSRVEKWQEFFNLDNSLSFKGSFIKDVESFDSLFFEISPREAKTIDPRQRLLLEECWLAIEDSCIGFEEKNVGVFIGVEDGDYVHYTRGRDGALTGNHSGVLSARISYMLDFNGPNFALNTSCSSSLVAVHQACNSLIAKECKVALAGGVNLMLTPMGFQGMIDAGMMSTQGRIKPFDDSADGILAGEGVGVVVLKPYQDCVLDGDPVYALINGSGINYDGNTNGLTSPDFQSQKNLLNKVLKQSKTAPSQIQSIMSHGTGTRLGDPIEVKAIEEAYSIGKNAKQKTPWCALISPKANFGHCFAASGVLNFIAQVQSLKKEMIPPAIECESPSSYVKWKTSPLYISPVKKKFTTMNTKKFGAVSSFGMSGTNAHVILSSINFPQKSSGIHDPIFTYSARTRSSLNSWLEKFLEYLDDHPNISATDICHSLGVGRKNLKVRISFVIKSTEDLKSKIRGYLNSEEIVGINFGELSDSFEPLERKQEYVNEISADYYSGNSSLIVNEELSENYVKGYSIYNSFSKIMDANRKRIWNKIHLSGYSFEKIKHWVDSKIEAKRRDSSLGIYVPKWKQVEIPSQYSGRNKKFDNKDHYIVLGTLEMLRKIEEELSEPNLICIPFPKSKNKSVSGLLTDLFFEIKKWVIQIKINFPESTINLIHSKSKEDGYEKNAEGLVGFAKTLNQEFSQLNFRYLVIKDPYDLLENRRLECFNTLDQLADLNNSFRIELHNNKLQYYSKNWTSLKSSENKKNLWIDGSSYLITGGFGGIAKALVKQVSQKLKTGKLYLIGRSELNEKNSIELKELNKNGMEVTYHRVDVSDENAVESLFDQFQKNKISLRGILHAAGVNHNSLFIRKKLENVQKVFSAKTDGVKWLDKYSKDMSLDWFIGFSSTSAVFGNQGQSDYAWANGYLDEYISERKKDVDQGIKTGKSISINWPYWESGGMNMKDSALKSMFEYSGMKPLPLSKGIEAMEQAVYLNESQIMVLFGDIVKIENTLLYPMKKTKQKEGNESLIKSTNGKVITDNILIDTLLHEASDVINIQKKEIDIHCRLSEYGFDSITFTELSKRLQSKLGTKFPPTLFYDYPSIDSLVDFLKNQSIISETRDSKSIEPLLKEEIAVVGISCSMPEANNLKEFWDNLTASKDCMREIPSSRWSWQQFYGDPLVEENKSDVKIAGFMPNVDLFDPLFFGISPKEAKGMDPQHRLLLTHVWWCLEDAGHSVQDISGTKTGVFIGSGDTGYGSLTGMSKTPISGQTSTGLSPSMGTSRISYFLDLHGPNESIDTACSSSLVAIHRACKSILQGESVSAFAGGVNTLVSPWHHISCDKAGMLSKDGYCKTFSNKADGYARGEGVGVLYLKTRRAAIDDGDNIYAIIKGSAENHGGRGNSLTAPNPLAQKKLLQEAYKNSGIGLDDIQLLEAHGTGTKLGDPIEINALSSAYQQMCAKTNPGHPIYISTVKSNIGHLEFAAGIAGVIKSILQLKNKKMVSSLHCDQDNPYIDFNNSPYEINKKLRDWEITDNEIRRVGVSSFGFGGVNAHVVLEEAPKIVEESEESDNLNLFTIILSARNFSSLKEMAPSLGKFIQANPKLDLQRFSYTLCVGRTPMEFRIGFTVKNRKELIYKLKQIESAATFDKLSLGDKFFKNSLNSIKQFPLITSEEILEISKGEFSRELYSEEWSIHWGNLISKWCSGVNLDWRSVFANYKRPLIRLSIPGYPFLKESYWIDTNKIYSNKKMTIVDKEDKKAELTLLLRQIVSDETGINIDDIRTTELLEVYGVDSIVINSIYSKLDKKFQDLSKTIFYEFLTLGEIRDYLLNEFDEVVHEGSHQNEPIINSAYTQVLSNESIAVVGISAQLPGANTIDHFWDNLNKSKSPINSGINKRWFHVLTEKEGEIRFCADLKNFDAFDPLFFSMSPQEALYTDPQERLFLKESYQALADAGVRVEDFTEEELGRCGVWGGITKSGFSSWNSTFPNSFFSTSQAAMVNRVSHYFNFQGPSVAVDSMCSSGAVAVHQARESLLRGEVNLALVGGVNLYLHPQNFSILDQSGLISSKKNSFPFGKEGEGFVPAEGIVVFILKRLKDADDNNDHIYGLIRGSSVNHDGRTNGFKVPNLPRQQQVMENAVTSANVSIADLDWIEAAGNGSKIGDAIELKAIDNLMEPIKSSSTKKVLVHSMKGLFGHGESVAGLVQTLKVFGGFKNGEQIKIGSSYPANSEIHLKSSSVELFNSKKEGWVGGNEQIVLVNSFGAGGVNCSLVLEKYTAPQRISVKRHPLLFLMSARSGKSLKNNLVVWAEYLKGKKFEEQQMQSICYTLQTGREFMRYRFAVEIQNQKDLETVIDCYLNENNDGSKYYSGSLKYKGDELIIKNQIKNSGRISEIFRENAGCGKILALWVQGVEVDWKGLHENSYSLIGQLPKYQFQDKSYWINHLVINVHTEELQVKNEVDIIPVIKAVLGLDNQDEIFLEDNFTEIGFDSISIVHLIEKINAAFGLSLSEIAAFNFSTVLDMNHEVARLISLKKKHQTKARETETAVSAVLNPLPNKTNSMALKAKKGSEITPLNALLYGVKNGEFDVDQALKKLDGIHLM